MLQYRTLTATTNLSVTYSAGLIALVGTTTPTISDYTNATHGHTANASGGTIAHSSLTGASSGDAHTQYVLLAGRTTGQTIIGAITAAGTLTLTATASATAGAIICNTKPGTEAWRTLATGEFIIGATTLTANNEILLIQRNQNAATYFTVANTTSNTAAFTGFNLIAGALTMQYRIFSAGYTTAGIYRNSTTYLQFPVDLVINSAGSGSVIVGDTSTLTADSEIFSVQRSINTSVSQILKNGISSTAAYAMHGVYAGAASYSYWRVFSAAYTPAGIFTAGNTYLESSGLMYFATKSNSPFIWMTGASTTEKMRLLTGGILCINATAAVGAEKLRIAGAVLIDVVSTTAFQVAKNTGSGTAFTVNTTTGYCVTPTIYGGTASGATLTFGGSLLNNPTAKVTICGSAEKLAFFGAAGAVKGTSGEDLTNNVTASGTTGTVANFTDLTTYANDATIIRADIYQLSRKLKQVNDALRSYGILT